MKRISCINLIINNIYYFKYYLNLSDTDIHKHLINFYYHCYHYHFFFFGISSLSYFDNSNLTLFGNEYLSSTIIQTTHLFTLLFGQLNYYESNFNFSFNFLIFLVLNLNYLLNHFIKNNVY